MKMKLLIDLRMLYFITTMAIYCNGEDWTYGDGTYGPANWSVIYPNCGGSKQSPVDIGSLLNKYDSSLGTLNIDSYHASTSSISDLSVSLVNTGHSVQLNFLYEKSSPAYYLKGSNLLYTYYLEQIHFHWGSISTRGSEHTFHSIPRSLEIHFVHYRSGLGNVTYAKTQPQGLAVLAVLVEASSLVDNEAFEPIISHLQEVAYKGQSVPITSSFQMFDMFPAADTQNWYYRYQGSLTTPTCDENVEWIVFAAINTMSEAQLEKFRTLYEYESTSIDQHHIVDNYRPVQPLNGRTIYTSFLITSGSTSATGNNIVFIFLFSWLLLQLIPR